MAPCGTLVASGSSFLSIPCGLGPRAENPFGSTQAKVSEDQPHAKLDQPAERQRGAVVTGGSEDDAERCLKEADDKLQPTPPLAAYLGATKPPLMGDM